MQYLLGIIGHVEIVGPEVKRGLVLLYILIILNPLLIIRNLDLKSVMVSHFVKIATKDIQHGRY